MNHDSFVGVGGSTQSSYVILDSGPQPSDGDNEWKGQRSDTEDTQQFFMEENLRSELVESPLQTGTIHHGDDEVVVNEDEHDFSVPLLYPTDHPSNQVPAQLSGLNFLNIVTYIAHLFCSWGIGNWGLDHIIPTRWDIAREHETLVTPAFWAYGLWAPILVFEAIFTVAQLLPDYRARPIIQDGTSFLFFYTCLCQIAWTLFFSFRIFILSFIAVMLALASLASLLARQHRTRLRSRQDATTEYYLLRFPFQLHFGWIVVMAAVHFGLLIRHFCRHDLATQLAADIVALGSMLPVASFFLLQTDDVNFVIPGVIFWAYIGIGCRLMGPTDTLVEDYGITAIKAMQQTCWFFAGIVGLLMIPMVVVQVYRRFCTINVVLLEDSSLDYNNSSSGIHRPQPSRSID